MGTKNTFPPGRRGVLLNSALTDSRQLAYVVKTTEWDSEPSVTLAVPTPACGDATREVHPIIRALSTSQEMLTQLTELGIISSSETDIESWGQLEPVRTDYKTWAAAQPVAERLHDQGFRHKNQKLTGFHPDRRDELISSGDLGPTSAIAQNLRDHGFGPPQPFTAFVRCPKCQLFWCHKFRMPNKTKWSKAEDTPEYEYEVVRQCDCGNEWGMT